MTKQKAFYPLPDYKTVTTDLDTYLAAWRDVAKPIEDALGVELSGFDPDFGFKKTNKDGATTQVSLPIWFTLALSEQLKRLEVLEHLSIERAFDME